MNRARIAGGVLICVLAPMVPTLGVPYALALGAATLGYAAAVAVYRLTRGADGGGTRLYLAVTFALDLVVVIVGLLVFSPSPSWTASAAVLLVMVAGFRLGPAGAFGAAGLLAVTVAGIALLRADRFNFPLDAGSLVGTIVIFALAAFVLSGTLREREELRTQREDFIRQSAEIQSMRETDRARSDFLASMSHDFRSPLTVVRGAIELLLDERAGSLTTSQRQLSESAARNVRRLEDFTEQLLEMARLEGGQVALDKESLDPMALVEEVVADKLELAQQKHQSIVLDHNGGPRQVVADRVRLGQAIGNLVGNAIRYAPNNTTIDVLTRCEDDLLRVEVRDHGRGLGPEDRERVFGKVYRGAVAGAGIGPGVAVARSLLALHGGSLEYADTPGGGTTFVAKVPVNEQ